MYSQRASLTPFLLLSFLLHLFFLVSWPGSQKKETAQEPLPVSFLPAPEPKTEPAPKRKNPKPAKKQNPTPPTPPAQVAQKTTPPQEEKILEEKRIARVETVEPQGLEKKKAPEETAPKPSENPTIVRRPLPTLKDLLPPVTWAPSDDKAGRKEEAVQLNTREPKYISYFASIKRAIELVWEYPEPALRRGLQGKLVLEFTILGNGQVQMTRLLRSSGVSVLDAEAIRAVKAASPFVPIPPWIGKRELDIIASFEYLDNRLKYRFAQ